MPEICTDVLLSSFSHIIDEEETETSYYYWQVKEIAFVIRFSLARFNTFLFLLYIFFFNKNFKCNDITDVCVVLRCIHSCCYVAYGWFVVAAYSAYAFIFTFFMQVFHFSL